MGNPNTVIGINDQSIQSSKPIGVTIMSKLTGSKNVKSLIKEFNDKGNVKGLFKRLRDQCGELKLPKNGSTADLVQRLMEWNERTKTKQLKKQKEFQEILPLLFLL